MSLHEFLDTTPFFDWLDAVIGETPAINEPCDGCEENP